MAVLSLTWPLAYYVPEDRYVTVDYLLRKRRAGDLRAGDCFDNREAFYNDEGIRLGPVDNESGLSGRRNCIRSLPGQRALLERRARRAGYNHSETNEFLRFLFYSASLYHCLSTDEDIRKHCQIDSVTTHPRSGQMGAPDFVIKHIPGCIQRLLGDQTNIVITDKNRIRPPRSGILNLSINQWTKANVFDFDQYGRSLFLRYWDRHVNGVMRRLREEEKAKRDARNARRTAKKARKARLRANKKEAIRLANLRHRHRKISGRSRLRDRAFLAASQWRNHQSGQLHVPGDRIREFPHIVCLDELCNHLHFRIDQWPDRLEWGGRHLISRAEAWGRIEMPRRYTDFGHLVSAAEADMSSIREHQRRIEGEKETYHATIALIVSSRDEIERITAEYSGLQTQIHIIRKGISNLRDRGHETIQTIRQNSGDITRGISDIDDMISVLQGDSNMLNDALREVTGFQRRALDLDLGGLLNQVQTAVEELGLGDVWEVHNSYWWNEEIDRESDLRRIASEVEELSNRLGTAMTRVTAEWNAGFSNYHEYLPSRGDYYRELSNRFRECIVRANTLSDNYDDRLRGKIRCLIGPTGHETHGRIMQGVGPDVFFSLDEVIGQAVTSGAEVRYAVNHTRARNRAVRVELIPPWVPPWRS